MAVCMGFMFGVYEMFSVYQEITEGKNLAQRNVNNMWESQNQNPSLMPFQLCNTDDENWLDSVNIYYSPNLSF